MISLQNKQFQSNYTKNHCFKTFALFSNKQGRKRPLDTPKRIIERREREGEREKER